MKQLQVDLGERSYPIYIGDRLIDKISELFHQHQITTKSPVMIITDENVAPHYLQQVSNRLSDGGYEVVQSVVAPGEKSKSLAVFEDIVTTALKHGLDRKSTIIALGGGVVGDLAGFVAASYMRGIRYVQIPTTILAHDSSVGGKVAVNHSLAKNIIGAFHQPAMVLFDTSTLRTLPQREVRAGLAEVLKHGLIWDEQFVQWVDEHSERLLSLDSEALQYALYQGCKVKAMVVSQDEKESGLRAILNLGHTIGHAIEAVAQYDEFLHGEAISIGMVGAARLSVKLGYPETIHKEFKRLLSKLGLPTRLPEHLDIDQIMAAMMHDKKFSEGSMVFIIPTKIGAVEINRNITPEWVKETLKQLKWEE